MFCKKGVTRNFAKFTGKHLCQSLFFNKVPNIFFMEYLWVTASNDLQFGLSFTFTLRRHLLCEDAFSHKAVGFINIYTNYTQWKNTFARAFSYRLLQCYNLCICNFVVQKNIIFIFSWSFNWLWYSFIHVFLNSKFSKMVAGVLESSDYNVVAYNLKECLIFKLVKKHQEG